MPLKNIGKDAKKQRMKLELFEPKMRKKKQREREKRVNMYGLKTEDLRSKTEKKKRKEKSANQLRMGKKETGYYKTKRVYV